MFRFFRSIPTNTVLAKEAYERAQKGEIRLIDVREAGEWAHMHVPGAMHAPLSSLAESLPQLPTDKPLVFYCLSGKRSQSAIKICRKHGLPHDTHLAGGITAWRAAGLPVDH